MTKFYLNNKRCLYNKVKSYLDTKGVTKGIIKDNYHKIEVFTDYNNNPWIILHKDFKRINRRDN